MGLYVIQGIDKPDGFALRASVQPAHLRFLDGLGDKLVLAGPYLDDKQRFVGSLVMVKARDQAEAETIAADDPYAQAGLFVESSVRPWLWALKPPQDL